MKQGTYYFEVANKAVMREREEFPEGRHHGSTQGRYKRLAEKREANAGFCFVVSLGEKPLQSPHCATYGATLCLIICAFVPF